MTIIAVLNSNHEDNKVLYRIFSLQFDIDVEFLTFRLNQANTILLRVTM